MSDPWKPCPHCGRIGPRYITHEEVERRLGEALAYEFRHLPTVQPGYILSMKLGARALWRLLTRPFRRATKPPTAGEKETTT